MALLGLIELQPMKFDSFAINKTRIENRTISNRIATSLGMEMRMVVVVHKAIYWVGTRRVGTKDALKTLES